MARCAALTASGDQCQHAAKPPLHHCYLHAPEYAEQRSAAASKAGKVRRGGELADLKRDLRQRMHDVLSGGVETGRAAVFAQLAGVFLRAVETERKIRDQEEMMQKLEELEDIARRRGWMG